MTKVWTGFDYWTVTLIAMTGGLIGIVPFLALLLAGEHRELGVPGIVRRPGDIRVALVDVEAAAVQLVLEGLGAEVLQPVVDGAGARLFDNGVLVEDHLLLVVQ